MLGGGDRNSAHAGKTTIEQKIIPKRKDVEEKEAAHECLFDELKTA